MLSEHSGMGHELDISSDRLLLVQPPQETSALVRPIPWLDAETQRYVHHVLTLLINHNPDLLAAVLFGSVARHQARPLTDAHPSDVDVLLIFDAEPGHETVSGAQYTAVSCAKVAVIDQYPHARDLQFALTLPTFAGWDTSFVASIARDGVSLWAREPLPTAIYMVQKRANEGTLVK